MSYLELHDAITAGHPKKTESLLNSGLDINAVYNQETPFTRAIQRQNEDIISSLLTYPDLDVNAGNQFRRTPLYFASQFGNLPLVKLLLSRGVDINYPDITGISPLMTSTWYNKADVTSELLRSGADINILDGKGLSPVYHAVNSTSCEVVRTLLQYDCNVNQSSKDNGRTPLMAAVRKVNLKIEDKKSLSMPRAVNIIKQLIDHGANLNTQDDDGDTALHMAVEAENIHAVILLLHHGCNANIRNKKNVSPLEMSLLPKTCRYEIAQFISLYKCLSNDIATNVLSSLTNTTPSPLSSERFRKEIFVVNMLLNEANLKEVHDLNAHLSNMVQTDITNTISSDMMAKYCRDRLPRSLQVACRNRIRESMDCNIIDKIEQLPIAFSHKIYLIYGYNYKTLSPIHVSNLHLAVESGDALALQKYLQIVSVDAMLDYQSPIIHAIKQNQVECIEILLRQGADQNISDGDGNCPIHVAAEVGNEQIVRLLLSRVESVHLKNTEGNLPLHVACIKGHFKSANILIEHGADVNIPDSHGRYPIHYASASGDVTSVKLIIGQAFDVNTVDSEGFSALHLAVTRGNMYLQRNIPLPFMFTSRLSMELTIFSMMYSPNSKVKSYAECVDHIAVVRLLLQNGSNINQESGEGKDAIELAENFGMMDIASIVKSY